MSNMSATSVTSVSQKPNKSLGKSNQFKNDMNSDNIVQNQDQNVFVRPPINTANQPYSLTTTTLNNGDTFSPTSSEPYQPYQQDPRLNQLNQINSSNQLNTSQLGGNNPALVAFREISALVAKKLNISNGPNAKKIASQLQKDVKEKNKTITCDKLVDAAKKHLDNNTDKYKKMV